MSRTRADALVLVNWKGVFYERYLLDRHVTALEGSNGAGKTTVMIAAYVVLLPDMSRLRFTNLGETGATGGDKGIWGRLGEPGRPSYAAIDFRISGARRLIAGAHLERKGEPSVEPTPFIVSGLDENIRLQDLMLVAQGDRDVVPELPELRENAARLGGRLQVFTSARDYFAALFDEGVTPLRLGTDEERNKLNEMLRTSMTGGISRALTSELRAFLLKEEGGLADTLQRMKANLDACRRSRTEVQESRRLEQEIGGVFEAGYTMFAAAVLATRERADELGRRVADAETARAAAAEARTTAEDALEGIIATLETAQARQDELERLFVSAKEWRARQQTALLALNDVARLHTALTAATANATGAANARAEAEDHRKRMRDELRQAQENYRRAASGLADIQKGIEELHRRAGAYHQVVRRLREAESNLGTESISTAELAVWLASSSTELARIDGERRPAAAQLADADHHRRQHAEVLTALSSMVEAEVSANQAHSTATEALRHHRDRHALAQRAPALARDLAEVRKLAEQQTRVRAQADKLAVALNSEPASAVVRRLLSEAEAERSQDEDKARTARSDLANMERTLKELDARRRELVQREPEWHEHDARAARLSEHFGSPIVDRAGLDAARVSISEKLTATVTTEEAVREAQEILLREARELVAGGGTFQPELVRLKDQLGADLVAGSFDDVVLEEAGVIEARLGPLAQALVVDDPRAAARAVHARAESLPHVLLVSREANLEELASAARRVAADGADVVVQDGLALRVSRIPARPRLGRRAREARATEMRDEAAAKALEVDHLRAKRRLLVRLNSDGEELLAGHPVWLAGNPATELAELRRKLGEGGAQIEVLRSEAWRHSDAARALRPRIDGLRSLLGDALLLDPPDYTARTAPLEEEYRSAVSAKAEIARTAKFAAIVDENLAVLRSAPLSDEEVTRMRQHVEELRRARERLDTAVDALEYVQTNSTALSWSESPARLADNQALVPAIEAQLREAEAAQTAGEQSANEGDKRYDAATADWQDADGRQRVATHEHASAEARFETIGIPAPTDDSLRAAGEEVARCEEHLQAESSRRDELLTARGRQENAFRDAQTRARDADDKLGSERREAEPAIARWERMRTLAQQHGVLAGAISSAQSEVSGIRGHVNLVQAAHSQRELLLERLRGAHGGPALLAELQILRDYTDATFADAFLNLWLTIRDWLRRRLPAQVAEVDDPREALLRLRDQLSSLEERLLRQENDLRGASEDVARGIDVQIRKARGQVTRLNKNLNGVSFGSIQGIRVRVQAIEKMEQVLRALRDGAAQKLLFQEDLPIEEALDEIFRRYGGGRTSGQRLLDYREYVHLQVEIQRKAGADWEVANPTRLSTGEAIGVGAALMMVVLTEWERDATSLRTKKSHGSLRFLFLDEANRLSHDNLGVLFDLCQTLDLQLLIAAPEVARAEGNTTYRLIRRTTPDGREEVLVSGRRTRPVV